MTKGLKEATVDETGGTIADLETIVKEVKANIVRKLCLNKDIIYKFLEVEKSIFFMIDILYNGTHISQYY